MGLGDTIKDQNTEIKQKKAKAMIFLRHHLHEGLRSEYSTIKDPLTLWKNLKERYDHQKTVILPNAKNEWLHLRFLCNQQYRERNFKKYSELISYLLVAEQNNELLMKNHESRPTGCVPLPEANATISDNSSRGRGCGHNQSHGCGHGYNQSCDRGRNNVWHRNGQNNNSYTPMKSTTTENKGKGPQNNNRKNSKNLCFRCGMKGHWPHTCFMAKHLVDLYQASVKGKEKSIEANFAYQNDDIFKEPLDITHLDVADFFNEDPINSNMNIYNGDENVYN
ncbi:uncharacterized protein LOC133833133 [Humulus lupulus]|uniref:uncharacterized protein LOC133833133 n=1 Tax=Humulus lupulus TaxID=3486 RepID=UPI002B40727E|nr:uncharacterized protein LOC133833133 [Humulus lupulus]